jgi:hypothetical protein
MRASLAAGLLALVALAAAGPAAARDRDFTHPPFAARTSGHVGVSVTFRHAARHVRISLAGRGSRVERIPGTRTAFYAVVSASGRMRRADADGDAELERAVGTAERHDAALRAPALPRRSRVAPRRVSVGD